MSLSQLSGLVGQIPILDESDLMTSLFLDCMMQLRFLRGFSLVSSMRMVVSLAVSNTLCSLLCKRSVSRVVDVSDGLSVLRKSIARREDSLGDILLIVVHMLMVLFLVGLMLSLISQHCVIVMEPSACGFGKINLSVGVCLRDFRLSSI